MASHNKGNVKSSVVLPGESIIYARCCQLSMLVTTMLKVSFEH